MSKNTQCLPVVGQRPQFLLTWILLVGYLIRGSRLPEGSRFWKQARGCSVSTPASFCYTFDQPGEGVTEGLSNQEEGLMGAPGDSSVVDYTSASIVKQFVLTALRN